MRKFLTIVLTVFILIIGTNEAFAGKGYSSGSGRSYSSGSSVSRSSSSSSFSRSSSPSVSKTPSSSGKSYSSGSKSYSTPKSSGSGGFSNKSTPSTGPPSKGYSNGSSSYSSSSKKPTGNFQSLAANEQRKAESRAHYQQATAPKETYTTPKGNSVTIKKDDVRVVSIRNMPTEKWVNRETRVQTFYHTYYAHPPVTVVHYNDPYSTFFWLWLMDRSLNDRAYWAYNHAPGTAYAMDEARYRDLLAKDKALEARIRQLEAEKKARDPNYIPPGMDDPDLQYTDEFVNASVNPHLKPHSGITARQFFYGVWVFIKWCFYIAVTIAVIWISVWLIFYKKW